MTPNYTRRVIAASLLLGASPLALAQEAPEPETLETVIVTGVGPQRETDEMIGNATAINRAELVEKLSGTLGDTLAGEAGVSTTFFGQGASRPVLRGLGAERVLVLTNGIGAIDASAASPDHQVATDGIDAEKIEILRGPAALAYGGQAIGGVVNVIDGLIVEKLPDAPVSFDGFAANNSVNEGTELAGKARFTTGPFVLTLSASARDFGDYDIPGFAESSLLRAMEEDEHDDHDEEDHDEDEDHDHEEHEDEEVRDTMENSFLQSGTYSAGFSWVGDDAFLGFAIRQQTSSYGIPGHEHHEHEEEEEEDHEDEDHEDEEDHDHEEEFAFIDLEQTRYDIRGGAKLDLGPITRIAGNLSYADYEHIEFEGPGEPGTIYTTEGTEGRLELGHVFGEMVGAAGVQFLDKDLGSDGEESFLTPTSTKTFGAFIYETLEFDDQSGLEGGLRFDNTELDNEVQGERSFDLFSASLGGHKHWTSGWWAGAQLSYTERAPNESELFADGAHLATSQYEVGDASLGKEKGTNLEATLRWENDRFSIGANVFHSDFDGFIYLTPGVVLEDGVEVDELDELPIFLFEQQGASFTGAEIEAEARFPEGLLGADWVTSASLDLVDGELDDGGNVPYLPPVTFHAALDADWGLWSAGWTMTAAADQDDPGTGLLPTDGYVTTGLKAAVNLSEAGFGKDGTQLFIEGRNLTDEEVRYSTSVLKDSVPAPGRNIRVGLRVAF
ncbi:TonB-dependent receptor [Hyphomonas sp.]|uniref:TonB-dependent receptor n=1 Tax=Hyphomonas sp. TaxID=87 RepID=UPI0025BCF184|nr:TonB-dependent receptor [Hyphomonas sp.]